MGHYVVDFNPIAISLGDIMIPWYWLVYFGGYVWLLWFVPRLAQKGLTRLSPKLCSDYVILSFFSMLIFSRLTYVFVYNFSYYQAAPMKIFYLWEGGMSFHGGLLGIWLSALFMAKRNNLRFCDFTDLAATSVAPLLFFGRLANFINGELAGRVSDVPWAMIFPRYGDGLARHPSQLYEALLEGLVTGTLMWLSRQRLYEVGHQSGKFLLLYGCSRFLVEFVRAPDAQLGLYLGFLTMGQILSSLMIIGGVVLMMRSKSKQ